MIYFVFVFPLNKKLFNIIHVKTNYILRDLEVLVMLKLIDFLIY